MLAMQTLATMAAFSIPAAAPAVARDLDVPAELVGFFVAAVYGVGIVSALLSPGFVLRFGPVRVSQFVLATVIVMLLAASTGSVVSLLLGAALLGVAYGATAPASTHLLVPHTPAHVFNLVMSIRQVGVPLGGVCAGLIVPPLVVDLGWRGALLLELPAPLLLLLLLQIPRRAWDAGRNPHQPLFGGALRRSLRLWQTHAPIRRLSVASFGYSGVQLAFIAFMTVYLTQAAAFDLVRAGWTLAGYQVAGAVSRPALGWAADRLFRPSQLLALLGAAMFISALAAAGFSPSWPSWMVVAVCLFAGATASGFTGLAYAEYARLGASRGTEATGLGSAAMFAGVLIIPPVFGLTATAFGSFMPSYVMLGLLALGSGLLFLRAPRGSVSL
ncbi:MAG TPA: MFS transporter [Candidatus Sulfotelmatobacter sp.]|nr:MFS transporter [Candidatus Sulfotelmatobacter sp.]